MKLSALIHRNLTYYWRTNLAVVLGVATAVAVLSGALLVGDSVRGSLRELVLQRLGNTDHAVLSSDFFREQLSDDIKGAPLLMLRGLVSIQGAQGRAGNVTVYGVDERFWNFHAVAMPPLTGREALISPSLAAELQTAAGATLLVHLQRPSDIPLESLHGRKADAGRTIRTVLRGIQPRGALGEFSLQAQQAAVRAVFVPLSLLQRELGLEERVNVLIANRDVQPEIRTKATLDDLGIRLRKLDNDVLALDPRSGVVSDPIAQVAAQFTPQSLFTYLANSMKVGSREIPYSLVTAIDLPELVSSNPPQMALTEWAAAELQAQPGDALSMEYFLWEEPGRLTTHTVEFRLAAVLPMDRADRQMAPEYPGISDALNLRDWDPPFPIDLRKIRPADEEYWKKYGTTPKAFITLEAGQNLWRSRYGSITQMRFTSPPPELEQRLRENIDPIAAGLSVVNVREQNLAASRGATNFGEYFVYFSFFLVVSALLLAALFFKLSVEQRIREVGLMRAVGIPSSIVRRIFLIEGLILSVIGAFIGTAGALAYSAAIVAALRTFWIGAVGTADISLHTSPASLVAGAVGGVMASVFCIGMTLRSLRRISDRSLLSGHLEKVESVRSSSIVLPAVLVSIGMFLLIAGMANVIPSDGAFFGAGFTLLTGALAFYRHTLARPSRKTIRGISQLGLRNVSYRPARSVVSMATIASATFILIAVDAFRKVPSTAETARYPLFIETLAPIVQDPNSLVTGITGLHLEPFRVRPGDDTSCLNLYEPKNPRILGARDSFIAAQSDNTWQLLQQTFGDGAIPVLADANSMMYVLHRKIGEDFVITNGGRETHLRFVGTLSDSIFQSELLMSEGNFLKLFPEQDGYSFLLAEGVPESAAGQIEDALLEFDADASSTAARLAEYHRVENTYLSTFQMLGGLGLLLGTVGLAAVLLRSILERRRELALLRTLGYQSKDFFLMTMAENAAILFGGLLTGVVCALIAIAPALVERGGRIPGLTLVPLLGAVLVLGLIVSLFATAAALRGSTLAALRSE
jgi:putative ABC transport system permease protein